MHIPMIHTMKTVQSHWPVHTIYQRMDVNTAILPTIFATRIVHDQHSIFTKKDHLLPKQTPQCGTHAPTMPLSKYQYCINHCLLRLNEVGCRDSFVAVMGNYRTAKKQRSNVPTPRVMVGGVGGDYPQRFWELSLRLFVSNSS